VNRWIKDADSKLVAGRKKEARAMYQKVYEKDPQNTFGKSDMAFVKMVSLMVDQDDDAKRQQAFNKIKEFEALFPNSEHQDYYTLIRATLAADLGDTNAAHKLLEEFPNRFPDSKYKQLAYDTWKSLPPVKKESTSKQIASKETPIKKSEKKKKAED
jgi:outer membrane protein assembly factor BamD (BamD/ComL family)